MESYSKAAMERAMKVQEVILRAIAKKITWWQAAEIIGISDRSMRRWRERLEEFGYDGLFDRRRGRPSPKRVPLALVEQVLGLYRERHFDLNVQHFHEKLGAQHRIRLSYSWVKQTLQGAGLVARGVSSRRTTSPARSTSIRSTWNGCSCRRILRSSSYSSPAIKSSWNAPKRTRFGGYSSRTFLGACAEFITKQLDQHPNRFNLFARLVLECPA